MSISLKSMLFEFIFIDALQPRACWNELISCSYSLYIFYTQFCILEVQLLQASLKLSVSLFSLNCVLKRRQYFEVLSPWTGHSGKETAKCDKVPGQKNWRDEFGFASLLQYVLNCVMNHYLNDLKKVRPHFLCEEPVIKTTTEFTANTM